ncbi:hypothetical protein D3C71_1714230 [compost metagenome]
MNADHSIMSQLGYSTTAVLTHMYQLFAQSIEYIAMLFYNFSTAANHEHQGSFNSCRLASGHWRVKEMSTSSFYSSGNFVN